MNNWEKIIVSEIGTVLLTYILCIVFGTPDNYL